jgi:signal peptidase I
MLRRLWIEWRGLIIFLVVMVLFRSAIADWNQVPTGSMKPTILEGDRVIVNKMAFGLRVPLTSIQLIRWGDPAAGDIITFISPEDDQLLIKRVIGVPGDWVAMVNNQLSINGESADYQALKDFDLNELSTIDRYRHRFFLETTPLSERAIMLEPSPVPQVNSFGPIEVPSDQYLVLGDNRDNSKDSRFIGFVSANRITGRAHTVAFSVDYEDYYLPRSNRFLKSLEVNR